MKKYLLYILFFFQTILFAQPITATLSADSSHILIGNPLTLRLSIAADNALQVQVPTLKDSLGKWEILQTSPVVKGNDKGKTIFLQNIVVTAWDSGRYEIPSLPILYMNGQDSQQIATNAIAIQVLTVEVDTTQAIKPIKAPLQAAYMWQEAIPYIGIVFFLLLVALSYFLYKKYQKGKEKRKIPLLPRPKALKAFSTLEKMDLKDAQNVKEYYAQISYILRAYISETKGFSAYEKVSDEIIEALSEKLSEMAIEDLTTLLSRSDLVKFAKYSPTAAEHTGILQAAKDWIRMY